MKNIKMEKKIPRTTTLGKRKNIYKEFHNANKTIIQLAEENDLTYWQVYRIVNAEVKISGIKKSKPGKLSKPKWSLDDFIDLDDFQLFLLMDTIEDLAQSKLMPQEKLKIVSQIETIQTKIQERQLRDKITRPEAEVIARIIRRFKPDATNKEIVAIYKEEFEAYMRERKIDK